MARRNKSMLVIVIILILLACVVIGIIRIVANKTDSETFFVKINGETYSQDTNDVIIASGSEIEIASPYDDKYDLSIFANITEDNNFEYYVGQELYTWKSVNNIDFSNGFDIQKNENLFVISYDSIVQIISSMVSPYDVVIATKPNDVLNMFILSVSSNELKINIGFTISDDSLINLSISSDSIVF